MVGLEEWRTPEFNEAIEKLLLHKPKRENLLKAIEELSELSTILLQKINKPDKVSDFEISEEIADCEMHLIILKHYFSISDEIRKEKVKKFLDLKEHLKWV